MGQKLYQKTEKGGIKFTSRRMGQVRIANYVYDLWLPLIGVKGLAVYGVYCRLERDGVVKAITQKDIAKACRIGPRTLSVINEMLVECGFIEVKKPEGHERLMHWTVEIVVLDPPREVPAHIVKKYQVESGYQPLSIWVVEDQEKPEEAESVDQELSDISDGVSQYHDEKSSGTANVVSLGLNPLEVSSATDVAGENEKSAKEFVGLFGENPSTETRDPPKNAEEFRERVMQAEVGWLAKAKNEPWLGWSDGRFRERDGVSVGAQERICALLEKHTGQKPVSDGQWKGWANTAVEVYNASTGRWDAVERGIRDAGARKARYVPNIASRRGDVNGWASAVSKALSEIEGERILMEI